MKVAPKPHLSVWEMNRRLLTVLTPLLGLPEGVRTLHLSMGVNVTPILIVETIAKPKPVKGSKFIDVTTLKSTARTYKTRAQPKRK